MQIEIVAIESDEEEEEEEELPGNAKNEKPAIPDPETEEEETESNVSSTDEDYLLSEQKLAELEASVKFAQYQEKLE